MCKHKPGDPNCGSYRPQPPAPKTPDAENYTVEDVEWVGQTRVVMMVKYPNCSNCAYEGNKVMVFLGVTVQQAMKWRRIDPHFRDPSLKSLPTHAPSPAARFPGTPEGWQDAISYAETKAMVDA